jgi:hypothetical protein
VLLTKNYWDYQIKEDEMGRECGTCGRDENCVQNFGEERQNHHLEDLSVDGTVISKLGCDCMDCIHLPRDTDKLQARVNAVINLLVPQNAWNFFIS